ncbi:MAG: TIGR01777 family oxidoreductase [Rickettsiales bacterium]
MKILITGGTGLIGSNIIKALIAEYQNINITIFTRNTLLTENSSNIQIKYIDDINKLDKDYNIIINLAGEPINKGRWTDSKKARILSSRIDITKKLIEYISKLEQKPELLISGSAIGFYGSNPTQIFTEDSKADDDGFTHQLCERWENIANEAKDYGVRVVNLRTGIVLAKEGGILKEMLWPFKLALGCQIGDGKAYMSWIHIKDLCNIIMYIINNKNIEGPVNGTAPNPVQNRDFSKTLAKVLNRPMFLTMPSFIVKIMFGEMGEALLLNGQRVLPNKITEAGYSFEFDNLNKALDNLFI